MVYVKLLFAPVHVDVLGVIVIVAITGDVPLFDAVNAAIFPVPDDVASPIDVLSFVQSKVVLATGPLSVTAAEETVLHMI
jgi:hypothetical protein